MIGYNKNKRKKENYNGLVFHYHFNNSYYNIYYYSERDQKFHLVKNCYCLFFTCCDYKFHKSSNNKFLIIEYASFDKKIFLY